MASFDVVADNSIVKRYIKSLYDVSVALGIENEVRNQLRDVESCILQIKNYKKFLRKLSLNLTEGRRFLLVLKADLGLLDEIYNFLLLLLENQRITLIIDVIHCYETFLKEIGGTKTVYVTHAKRFFKSDKEILAESLRNAFGSKIELITEKDASLVGGIAIRYRSKILDYSVKSKLKRLHSAIRGDDYEN